MKSGYGPAAQLGAVILAGGAVGAVLIHNNAKAGADLLADSYYLLCLTVATLGVTHRADRWNRILCLPSGTSLKARRSASGDCATPGSWGSSGTRDGDHTGDARNTCDTCSGDDGRGTSRFHRRQGRLARRVGAFESGHSDHEPRLPTGRGSDPQQQNVRSM
jgi:hypothetical protein